jgi:hypothetical protein
LYKGQSFNIYEIKATKTLKTEMTKNLSLIPIKSSKKFVVSFNENSIPLAKDVIAISWKTFVDNL